MPDILVAQNVLAEKTMGLSPECESTRYIGDGRRFAKHFHTFLIVVPWAFVYPFRNCHRRIYNKCI